MLVEPPKDDHLSFGGFFYAGSAAEQWKQAVLRADQGTATGTKNLARSVIIINATALEKHTPGCERGDEGKLNQ